jgi:hypothetical protein
VDVTDVADVSEVRASSIFRVEVSATRLLSYLRFFGVELHSELVESVLIILGILDCAYVSKRTRIHTHFSVGTCVLHS